MASTRFFKPTDNKVLRYSATATYPRICNGNGAYPGAPALVQDSMFPASNLHLPSRYSSWVIPAGSASPCNLQFDLGSNQAIVFAGFFGLRHLGAGSNVSFDVGFRTSAQGYSATGYTSAASGTISSSARDHGAIFTVGQLGRYWQISLTSLFTVGFSVGKIALCTSPQDLGFLYTADMDDELIHPTIQTRTGSGHLSAVAVGDDRRLVSMPFDTVDDATRTKIDNVFGPVTVRDPAIWLDRSDVARQVVLARNNVRWRHIWDAPNLWSTDLELEVLG